MSRLTRKNHIPVWSLEGLVDTLHMRISIIDWKQGQTGSCLATHEYSWAPVFTRSPQHQQDRERALFWREGSLFLFIFFTFFKYYFTLSLCFPLVQTVLESYGGRFRCLQKSGMTSELYSGRYWGLQGSWSITRTYTPKRQNIHRN